MVLQGKKEGDKIEESVQGSVSEVLFYPAMYIMMDYLAADYIFILQEEAPLQQQIHHLDHS